jgi:hypothetical protein
LAEGTDAERATQLKQSREFIHNKMAQTPVDDEYSLTELFLDFDAVRKRVIELIQESGSSGPFIRGSRKRT